MYLHVMRSVDDRAAGILQALCPADVVFLIEAGAELDQNKDVLAVFCRLTERLDDAAVGGNAVERDLDGRHIRVDRRLIEQPQEGRDGFIGIGQQNIPLGDLGHHRLFRGDVPAVLGLLHRKAQVGRVVEFL